MRTFIQAVKQALQYRVTIVWEGETFIHHSWAFSDALQWAACYPRAAFMVMHRFHGIQAMRRAA